MMPCPEMTPEEIHALRMAGSWDMAAVATARSLLWERVVPVVEAAGALLEEVECYEEDHGHVGRHATALRAALAALKGEKV